MTYPDKEKVVLEKLSDVSDIATESEMTWTANALKAARAKVRQDQSPDSDGVYAILDCVECDLEIGIGRLRVAPRNKLCVYCAALAERNRG